MPIEEPIKSQSREREKERERERERELLCQSRRIERESYCANRGE